MKKRRWIAMILAGTMLAMMAGCGGDAKPAATEAPAAETAGAEAAEPAATEAGEGQAPTVDRGNEFVTVATGPSSGIYFPIGGAFAEALKAAGYDTSAQATGASAENIDMILKGDAELAIAMQDSVMQAYEGFGAYEEKGASPDLRALMRLWPNYV